MNAILTSNAFGCGIDTPAFRTKTFCTQHLQPTRQFGPGSLRLCRRQQHRARKDNVKSCLAAALEAPSAPSSSTDYDEEESSDEEEEEEPLDTEALYKQFGKLLGEYTYSYKQGDRVKGTVFGVDQRGAYVEVGAKAAATCPSEECSLAGMPRVLPPLHLIHVVLYVAKTAQQGS